MSKHIPESEMRSSATPVDTGSDWVTADKITEPLANYGADRERSGSPLPTTVLSELSAIARMISLMTTEEKAANLERIIEFTKDNTEENSNA